MIYGVYWAFHSVLKWPTKIPLVVRWFQVVHAQGRVVLLSPAPMPEPIAGFSAGWPHRKQGSTGGDHVGFMPGIVPRQRAQGKLAGTAENWQPWPLRRVPGPPSQAGIVVRLSSVWQRPVPRLFKHGQDLAIQLTAVSLDQQQPGISPCASVAAHRLSG